jgi:hypothetical protein
MRAEFLKRARNNDGTSLKTQHLGFRRLFLAIARKSLNNRHEVIHFFYVQHPNIANHGNCVVRSITATISDMQREAAFAIREKLLPNCAQAGYAKCISTGKRIPRDCYAIAHTICHFSHSRGRDFCGSRGFRSPTGVIR